MRGVAYSKEYGYETFCARNTVSGGYNVVNYVREPNSGVNVNGIGEYHTADEFKSEKYMPVTMEQLKDIPDIALTQEGATAQAEMLLSQIGEDAFTCYAAEKVYGGSYDIVAEGYGVTNPLRCVWRLSNVRTVNGIMATYTNERGSASEDELQAEPWSYETMMFYIDDSGIVAFQWGSPYAVTETLVEDANVKSFGEVMSVFEKMLPAKFVWNTGDNTGEVTISQIRLGLARVTEQNERNTGLLIPVWDFFGTVICTTEFADGMRTETSDDLDSSLLTINAIDGSVIDRGLGY
jgi:hypothetical protein